MMDLMDILAIGVVVGITNIVMILAVAKFFTTKAGIKLYYKWYQKNQDKMIVELEQLYEE